MRLITLIAYRFCTRVFWFRHGPDIDGVQGHPSDVLVNGGLVSKLWSWIWSLPVEQQGWRTEMIIHPAEQGSAAWTEARLGIPTASQFSRIITPGGKLSKSRDGYHG